MKRWSGIVLMGVVLTAALALPAGARAPLRSGTIVGGWGQAGMSAGTCAQTPDCLAWLAAGCPPALADKDPAANASIVDVRKLAGSTRTYGIAYPYENGWFGSTVEFWSGDCGRLRRYPESWSLRLRDGARLAIPHGTAWMTVTTGGIAFSWELR